MFLEILTVTLTLIALSGGNPHHAAMDDIIEINTKGNITHTLLYNVDERLSDEQAAVFQSTDSKVRRRRALLKQWRSTWPNAEVPYTISNDYNATEKKMIKDSMRNIESVSCLRFIEYDLYKVPRAHLSIFNNGGCWSNIGYYPGRQTLSLDPLACFTNDGVITHELLHILGFFHEQERRDRDRFVKINWENIDLKNHGEFQIRTNSHEDGLGVEYDMQSIMHYGAYAFSNNEKATIVDRKGRVNSFGNDRLSQKDIEQLNLYYKCKPKKTTKTTPSTTTSTTMTTTECEQLIETSLWCSSLNERNYRRNCRSHEYLCPKTCCLLKNNKNNKKKTSTTTTTTTTPTPPTATTTTMPPSTTTTTTTTMAPSTTKTTTSKPSVTKMETTSVENTDCDYQETSTWCQMVNRSNYKKYCFSHSYLCPKTCCLHTKSR